MSNEDNGATPAPASQPQQSAPTDHGHAAKNPDYIAYSVKDTPDGKGHWNRVGAAWEHGDGKGVQLQLDSMPIDGRITLREMRDQRMQNYADQRKQRTQEQPQTPAQHPSRGQNYER